VKDTRQNFRLVGGSEVIRLGIVRIRLHRSDTKDYGGFVAQASDLLKQKLALPPGFTYKWSGEYEFELRAKERLQLILPIVFCVISRPLARTTVRQSSVLIEIVVPQFETWHLALSLGRVYTS